MNISTRCKCSLPRGDKVKEQGFEAVGKDFGDNFVGDVAKIDRAVLVDSDGVGTFGNESNKSVVHLCQ